VNNLAYTSQDAATVGPKVEEKVREDVGATAPIPYEVQSGDVGTVTVGSVAEDIGKYFLGGRANSLFTLHFSIPEPRVAQLVANVVRYGRGSFVGLLVYIAVLSKPIAAEVILENPKMFGKPKFGGDPAVSAKLNANGPLVKLAGELARTEGLVASGQMKIDRYCHIVPNDAGAVLVLNTLPRMLKMGMSATTDAGQFLQLAGMIEAAL